MSSEIETPQAVRRRHAELEALARYAPEPRSFAPKPRSFATGRSR
jgi:hypothetical protein